MSIVATENAGPGPCDLQDPLWVKMSAITGTISKKRKKSDAKPQSQINKCLNEKRRRNLENLYIDELAELYYATDMSSGKTDKCQILNRTVEQLRQIDQDQRSISHAVQQGEVTSTNATLLPNKQYGPVVLEALDGFLFVVNAEGRVNYVTENITDFINYTKKDVLGKDIYNIVHHGDHNIFMSSLSPMSLGWTSEPQLHTGSRTFSCRFLVKPPDDKEETMEEKQQRVSQYETMHISSSLLTSKADRLELGDISSESSDIGPCVMCVARKTPHNEKPVITPIEQFTVKLDVSGKIIAVDTSWLSPAYSKYLTDLKGTVWKDLCHPHDLNKLTAHLNDTLQIGEGTSSVYRLCITPDKVLNIQTKSKLFKANVTDENDSDFVMATNSIIGDNIEGGQLSNSKVNSGQFSVRANNSNSNPGKNNNNVGGPLMGHVNGQVNNLAGRGGHAGSSSSSSSSFSNPEPTGLSTTSLFNNFTGSMDLEFEFFPSSAWELEGGSWPDRPESRASQQNSRPPSQPTPASPQGTAAFSSNTATLPPAFSPSNAATFSNPFPFSPVQESSMASAATPAGSTSTTTTTLQSNGQQTLAALPPPKDKSSTSLADNSRTSVPSTAASALDGQNSLVSTESGRLRNLLTKGSNEDSQDNTSNDCDNQNKHRILKILLNQQDDDDYHPEHSNKMKASPSSMPKAGIDHTKSSLGNNMLLQLLNEKNDDEDEEARAGLKKRNELLQQLLKDQDEERKMQEQQTDDPLLVSLGFRNTTPSPSHSGEHIPHTGTSQIGQKRPGEDGDLNVAVKRPMDSSHQVTSSANNAANNTSKLWEKNKMLASLLAKQPPQTTSIPPVPASVISATPQDKLPRVGDRLKQQQQQQQQPQQGQQQPQPQQQPWSSGGSMQTIGGSNTITTTATSARTPLQSQPRQLPRQATNSYLSHMLSQQHRPQMGQMDPEFANSGEYRQPGTDPATWDNNQSSDPDLSDILDQVIEFVPDEAITDSSAIANLLDVIEESQNNAMNEKMAINAIQKSLMLCETAVNPTSSTITIPVTPPAYSTALGNTPVTTTHSYQPPPVYQQQPRMRFNAQLGVRQAAAQFTPQQQQQHLQLQQQQRTKQLLQQQQLKQRLLQQQQQQQLLIPSNATATDQITTGIHNIDNLLNNTVAPNVSLQRSSVPDSQVSPGYGGSVQMPSGHRLAHSYSHPAALPQHSIVSNSFNNNQQVSAAARLSPHSPGGILSFSHPQPVSPRVTQGNYGNNPRLFNVNQVRSQQQAATPQQQQQQQQQLQQQRSMPSPGTPASARQSPFPAEAFPPPTSPTASQFPPAVPNPAGANPSTQYRLQRTTSTPSATTQLPGNASTTGSMTSEFVRQELRAIVGARTQQQQQQQQQQRVPNNIQNNLSGQVSQDEFEALGLTFEMSPAGEAVISDGPAKSWAIGSAGSAPSSSRTTMEEVARGDPKSSLLQKLLSE
ncbi:nuclear receptor coactivator 2 isoform X2 [Prorops nasuta]|uniref:nuclear receptor coactivator 2 isoform X2 n=1 Tax=Prorops nasuta TaxID=863751 RepID=UPI0034CED496